MFAYLAIHHLLRLHLRTTAVLVHLLWVGVEEGENTNASSFTNVDYSSSCSSSSTQRVQLDVGCYTTAVSTAIRTMYSSSASVCPNHRRLPRQRRIYSVILRSMMYTEGIHLVHTAPGTRC